MIKKMKEKQPNQYLQNKHQPNAIFCHNFRRIHLWKAFRFATTYGHDVFQNIQFQFDLLEMY